MLSHQAQTRAAVNDLREPWQDLTAMYGLSWTDCAISRWRDHVNSPVVGPTQPTGSSRYGFVSGHSRSAAANGRSRKTVPRKASACLLEHLVMTHRNGRSA
jgi:hypothetical protein